MKLTIGENIRNFRKKNDLTQEALAERLGVTYQSISRWENGTTYPDLELLPAISETLAVTVDELLGIPQIEKEKRALETVDELRRECMKQEYDADRIVELLRDIRRNYLACKSAWRPWADGNDRAFRDPAVLPEVRLLASAYLTRDPMDVDVIRTMSSVEDEEHIEDFLKKHTTPFDCSARELLFMRYWRRGDAERFEKERHFRLFQTIDRLFDERGLSLLTSTDDDKAAATKFSESLLNLIRRDAVDDCVDMWVEFRLRIMLDSAAQLAAVGQTQSAIQKVAAVVELLEDAMSIKEEVLLPTSCRFFDGMERYAEEFWHSFNNHPDAPKERCIRLHARLNDVFECSLIFPSIYLQMLQNDNFAPLRTYPEFEALCDRVKALVVKKDLEN